MDLSNFGFQDIPGLLSPQMNDNIRNQMMMGAAIGLIKGGGPSPTPNFFGAFGDGLQGALAGRQNGQNAAYKQLLEGAQIQKLKEESQKFEQDRQQRAAWQQIFAGGGTPAPAPTPAPDAGMPPGVMTPPSPAPITPPVQAAPQGMPQGMPQGVMSPQNAPPIMPAAPIAAPPVAAAPVAPGPTSTPAGVQADASVSLQRVLQNMPPAMRQMIGIMGPTQGMAALSTYIGKKFDKPSDSFLTVQGSDGSFHSFRADNPALDQAIAAGGKIVTTPSSEPTTSFATVQAPDGSFKSFRADDPAIDQAIAAGGKIVTTPSSNPNDRTKKPDAYLLPDGTTVLSADGLSYTDANGQKQAIPQTGTIKLGADTAFEASRAAKVQARAQAALDASATAAPGARPPAEGPASKGTGPWSALKGAADAIAGGAGLDAAFGKQGVFPETTANRQYLRDLRQVAKTALVNNPRFPVAEQKNVDELFPDPDTLWTNPNSEVQKIPILRNTLQGNLDANNAAIASGGLTKEELSRLSSNNIEIQRALRMLGPGDASLKSLGPSSGAPPAATAAAPAMPAAVTVPAHAAQSAWASLPVGRKVQQGGKTYQKGANGNAVEVPQ